MLTFLRWLAGFALTLVLLIAIAIIVVPRVVDPNDYRDDIIALVKDKTGRDLALDGNLSISVFPWLGIKTQGLSLSQPDNIGGEMLSVDTAQLRVKFAPLLSKRVEVDTVVLESPTVRLVTLNDGNDSFTGLSGSPSETTDESDSTEATAAVALVIQGLELTNGQVTIEDRQANTTTEIAALELVTGNLIGAELAEITIAGLLKDSANPLDTRFKLDGLARIDTDTLAVTAKAIDVSVEQGDQSAVLEIGNFSFVEQKIIDVQQIAVDIKSAQAIKILIPSVKANLDTQVADISDIGISSGDLTGSISNLKVSGFVDDPKASGTLSVSPFNAAKLVKEFDIDFVPTDTNALNSVALNAAFSGGLNGASIKDLVLNLDQTTLKGAASIAGFDKPKIKFDLNLDQLNLDSYLPETTEEETTQASTGSALAIPMAVFKDVDANGRFRAGHLVAGGLELENIDVQVISTPGNVTITPTADLYQGKLGGDIAYSESSDGAQLKIDNEVGLVALGEMLNAAEVTDQLSGLGRVVVDLLITEKDGIQSNQGTIKLLAKDGAIKGVDIKGIVDKGYASYRQFKGTEPEEAETGEAESSDETKFAELLGTFYLKNNLLTNDDFSMKAPLFRVGGRGEINLEAQTLDYLVNFSVVNTTDGQGGEAFEKLKGLTIPIRLSGDLAAPNYSLDMQALYSGLLKREIDKKKDEYLQDKLGIEGGDELSTKDVLKQLLIKEAVGDDEPQERPVQDIGSGASEEPQPEQTAEPEEPQNDKSPEDQLKDDLKKKLLDSIFK